MQGFMHFYGKNYIRPETGAAEGLIDTPGGAEGVRSMG